jgi:hypothetical protein
MSAFADTLQTAVAKLQTLTRVPDLSNTGIGIPGGHPPTRSIRGMFRPILQIGSECRERVCHDLAVLSL